MKKKPETNQCSIVSKPKVVEICKIVAFTSKSVNNTIINIKGHACDDKKDEF